LDFATPKTKDALAVLNALKCGDKRSLVVYAGESADTVKKSFANVTNVRYVSVNYLNPQDMLWSQAMIVSNEAIAYLNTLS
jgi:ribosomal protein L4